MNSIIFITKVREMVRLRIRGVEFGYGSEAVLKGISLSLIHI